MKTEELGKKAAEISQELVALRVRQAALQLDIAELKAQSQPATADKGIPDLHVGDQLVQQQTAEKGRDHHGRQIHDRGPPAHDLPDGGDCGGVGGRASHQEREGGAG